MNTFWVQVDVQLDALTSRFYMNDCGGRDQVVNAVNQFGWRGYEPPLPEVIAKICRGWKPVFVDVGANTGYYSLLAACSGASKVYAFEPVPSIYQIFTDNIRESALQQQITTFDVGIGEQPGSFTLYLPEAGHGLIETSASLNKDFRATHSAEFEVEVTTLDAFGQREAASLAGQQLLMKIDVETLEPQVILGGLQFIAAYRPVIAIEILPGTDVGFFERFCADQNYDHIWLRPGSAFDITGAAIETSLQHRDHLLIPREKTGAL
ncbi:MAG: FkbM family methyltransferase [Rhodoferax sp.]|nr:FkbM family methyltransferase [Rhodoferax sp.]